MKELSENQKDEIKAVVFYTLDFCGNNYTAVLEYCKENGLDVNGEVEAHRLFCVDEYYKIGK